MLTTENLSSAKNIFHIAKVLELVTIRAEWDLRLGTHLKGGTWDRRPRTLKLGAETRDSETGFSEHFLSFPGNIAIMNVFMCFIRLCLFCMFLITLSYGIYTFILLSS